MSKKDFVQQLIIVEKIVPLYYHDDLETSLAVLKTLYKAGIKIVEYTNRGSNAVSNFTSLKKIVNEEMKDLQLGAGTIKTKEEAKQFIAVGADFIVCPIINIEVGKIVQDAGILWIPGCMTPTEIFTAEETNASLIKIFPANIVGPTFIKSMKDLFPNLSFMPTGGVGFDEKNLMEWFDAGACAVGLGSKLISKEDIDQSNYNNIQKRTTNVLNFIKINL